MTRKIRIESVRVGDLVEYERKRRQVGKTGGIAPLTPTRAEAHSRNPLASLEDIGLFTALQGDICIGHVSIVPSVLRQDQARCHKIAWTSAFFVHPEYRNGTAAFQLMRKLTSLGMDVFVTGYNEPSRAICAAYGFKDFGPLRYLRIDFRGLDLPSALIHRACRMVRFKRKSSASFLYPRLRSSFLVRCQKLLRSEVAPQSWRVVEKIAPLPEMPSSYPDFERDVTTINWMLDNPWLRTSGPTCDPPYYFSDLRSEFQYVAAQLYDARDAYSGFAVFLFTERDGKRVLKSLDNYAPGSLKLSLLDAAIHLALRHHADQILLPESLAALVSQFPLNKLCTWKQRCYQWYPGRASSAVAQLEEGVSSIRLQYADGDCAFG